MRQGLLSEPKASSGPAAMLLAVSRSPSSIPRRSPCPERCHLPLASLNHIHLSKPQKHPRLHPPPDRCHLPLASLSIHLTKPQKHPRLHPLPGAMPPFSGVPLHPNKNGTRQFQHCQTPEPKHPSNRHIQYIISIRYLLNSITTRKVLSNSRSLACTLNS